MEVTLQSDQNLVRFVNIYRPPYSKKNRYTLLDFFEEFQEYLQILHSKNGTPILVGDFNIHVEKCNDINSKRFCDILSEFNLQQNVPHIPTHIEGGTLDLIITDKISNLDISSPDIIKLGTNSDHYYVSAGICNFHFCSKMDKSKLIKYRKFKDIHVQSFRDDLSRSGIMDTTNFKSLEHATDLMENTLCN